MSYNPVSYLDNKTIDIAKDYELDRKLIKKCEKTKHSLDKEDVIYHRNLQTQVYAVSTHNNKDIRKVNNQILHYGDKPNQTLDGLPQLKEELIKKYNLS